MVTFLGYPKCSTCRKAKAWLAEQGVSFDERDIVARPLTAEELRMLLRAAGVTAEELVNPKGTRYRELELRGKELTPDQWEDLLTREGKLYRRPILWTDAEVVIGFDPERWRRALGV